MTELRQHLQAAQAQYQAARYPGDLARDVLPPQIGQRRRLPIKRLGAVAAMIVILLMLRAHGPNAHRRPVRSAHRPFAVPHQVAGGTVEMPSIPAAPAMPNWPSLPTPAKSIPSTGELRAPPMPSAPAWSAPTPSLPRSKSESKAPQEAI